MASEEIDPAKLHEIPKVKTPEGKPISYLPTEGLTYDPNDQKYWDDQSLRGEINRVFEVCNGCRMCFKFCDSFPSLFKMLDSDEHGGDTRKLEPAQVGLVMDSCFQCKLCEVQCPYTPRDGHEYQLDFPKLVHRYEAQKVRAQGVSLRDEFLGNPDLAGSLARASLGTVNVANKVTAHRWLMEKALGIHRKKLLPDFANKTFERWAEDTGHMATDTSNEVVLFQTCFVQNNEPQVGRDTVEVLEKSEVKVGCLQGLKCCGMPAWEHGDLDSVRKQAKENLRLLGPHVDAGAKVLAINPTCSMMMRREYPELVEREDRPAAEKLAAAVMDPSEYLWSIRKEPRFNRDFQSTPGDNVAYHAPCHLRAQGKGFKGRDLIKQIPGVAATSVLECCGHDGTYAMKVESFESSARVGRARVRRHEISRGRRVGHRLPAGGRAVRSVRRQKNPLHPMTVLAKAYRKDGFPTALPPKKKEGEE